MQYAIVQIADRAQRNTSYTLKEIVVDTSKLRQQADQLLDCEMSVYAFTERNIFSVSGPLTLPLFVPVSLTGVTAARPMKSPNFAYEHIFGNRRSSIRTLVDTNDLFDEVNNLSVRLDSQFFYFFIIINIDA